MTRRSRDTVRLAAGVLVAIIAADAAVLGVTDPQALPVGCVFLLLVAVSRLSGVYRYADVVAACLGIVAYAVLEQGRGSAGLVSWATATASLSAACAAIRFLEARLQGAERHVQRTQEVMEDLLIYDTASGLLKSRYGEHALEEEVRRARRTQTALTLLLIAADPVLDHPVEALPNEEEEAKLMGALLQENLRLTDKGTRLTSTLFAAILPATNAAGGAVVAAKLGQSGEQHGSRPLRCGVATFPDHAVSAQDLLAEAQAALHLARAANLSTVTPAMLRQLEAAT
jgi:GGDEF domain-containing protein